MATQNQRIRARRDDNPRFRTPAPSRQGSTPAPRSRHATALSDGPAPRSPRKYPPFWMAAALGQMFNVRVQIRLIRASLVSFSTGCGAAAVLAAPANPGTTPGAGSLSPRRRASPPCRHTSHPSNPLTSASAAPGHYGPAEHRRRFVTTQPTVRGNTAIAHLSSSLLAIPRPGEPGVRIRSSASTSLH